jgi:hypothetical protein
MDGESIEVAQFYFSPLSLPVGSIKMINWSGEAVLLSTIAVIVGEKFLCKKLP